MSKDDSSKHEATDTELRASDPDPVQIGNSESEPEPEATDTELIASDPDPVQVGKSESDPGPEPEPTADAEKPAEDVPVSSVPAKPRRSWFSFFNFLLILALAAAAGYYWWQQQQLARDYQATIVDLKQQLAGKAAISQLDSNLSPLKGEISELGSKLDTKLGELELAQQGLRESSEKLYQLFGRDKNAWQLAEVEYLMRVAQHKLILQDDFEGAAITLQAASDKIGLTGDPGLLPVRVMISEEIADLKTRKRADLVGMTLILAQLGRQVRVLQPGFAVRVDEIASAPPEIQASQDWLDRFTAFIDSLVQVRNESMEPTVIEANIADVSERLEDNLKLARWAVLERDNNQYQLLIEQSLRLLREFYDLDNAANNDFLTQLQDLQKMVLKPVKPDINGSLRELQRILSLRENEPQPAQSEATEGGNG